MAGPKVCSWPPRKREDGTFKKPAVIEYVPLSAMLLRAFNTDAHFAAYSVPEPEHRLNSDAIANKAVAMVLLVFDVDCAVAHGNGGEAPESWWRREKSKVDALLAAHRGAIVYRTRGGYRIIYRLVAPFELGSDTAAAKLSWSRFYVAAGAHLARAFGIVADPKCKDWTRLYRAPLVRRDGDRAVVEREVIGEPRRVGTWTHEPGEGERALDLAFADDLGPAWRAAVNAASASPARRKPRRARVRPATGGVEGSDLPGGSSTS